MMNKLPGRKPLARVMFGWVCWTVTMGIQSGCLLFQNAPPCQNDENCPVGSTCDLDAERCIGASVYDAGRLPGADGGESDAGLGADGGANEGGDAGTSQADGGDIDAGTPMMDAGTPMMDAGTPMMDAGTPMMDAGTPMMDAGTPMMDAGTPTMDAGAPMMDAGVPMMDAGSPDSGTLVPADGGDNDAGQPDAGVTGICGNGIVEGLEACDDGNQEEGDGCISGCTISADYICWGRLSICDTSDNIAWVVQNDGGTLPDGGYTEIEDAIASEKPTIFIKPGHYNGFSVDQDDMRVVGADENLGTTLVEGKIRINAGDIGLHGVSVQTNDGDCIELTGDAENTKITDLQVLTCGNRGIEMKNGAALELDRCRVQRCGGFGMHLESSFVISNCVIDGNTGAGVKFKGSTSANSKFLFNTIKNNGSENSPGAMDCDSVAIVHGALIIDNSESGGKQNDDNCKDGIFFSRLGVEDAVPENHNSDCIPTFESDGYHLAPGNPCENSFAPDAGIGSDGAGDPLPNWPQYDYDGEPRLMGPGYEPGADEIAQ
jgi:cysteine-rich repeat protein